MTRRKLDFGVTLKNICDFNNSSIEFIFCDIDDTLTLDGKLPANSYHAIWNLYNKGFKIIPVTGRPAGWCEMIARFWPVEGVIGENGAFYFKYESHSKRMVRYFDLNNQDQDKNSKILAKVNLRVKNEIPKAKVSSDQFARMFDLAIDFCEDVTPPLSKDEINHIVKIFEEEGAQAKVSSIHVNGWVGNFDKVKTCKLFCKNELKLEFSSIQDKIIFIGDSPNDEPMFKEFKNSVAVSNIKKFLNLLNHPPAFVTKNEGGDGFVEFSNHIISLNSATETKD